MKNNFFNVFEVINEVVSCNHRSCTIVGKQSNKNIVRDGADLPSASDYSDLDTPAGSPGIIIIYIRYTA